MKRISASSILLVALFCATPTIAQIRPAPPRPIPCPKPMNDNIQLTTPAPDQRDFAAATWAAPRAGLNSTLNNHQFLHTFRWDSRSCCQVLSATLTVRMKAIDPASSRTASDAGNDVLGISRLGVGVAVSGAGYIWPLPSAVGATIVKTITFNAAQLADLNIDNRVSMYVEDDTAVVGATLTLQRCCLDKPMS